MAKILVTFFNGIDDTENPNSMPAFYEAFINGLDRAGNEVAVFSHKRFGMDFGPIDEDTEKVIKDFAPDICFVFNNSFYDLADVVSCPIVIYEVDSPRYYSNKDNIRNKPDRYLYFICQEDNRKTLVDEYGVKDEHIFLVPFFTEIYADDSVEQNTNICFIGSLFAVTSTKPFQKFMEQSPSEDEWNMMRECINHLRMNPQVTPTELVYQHKITSELVARSLNLPELLMMLSGEKRLKVLSAVADLGLDLYGTKNWRKEYVFDVNLNMAYINKPVYSVAHNQEIYNTSKIGINVSHLQAVSGFPWRVMDIMASNACLVSDFHSDFEYYFDKVQIPTYESEADAREVCKRLLEDKAWRKDVVLQCQEVVNKKYRFKHLLIKLEEYSGVSMHI